MDLHITETLASLFSLLVFMFGIYCLGSWREKRRVEPLEETAAELEETRYQERQQ